MSRRKIEIEVDDGKIKFGAWAIGAAFSAFFLMNALHVEDHELQKSEESIHKRIMMSESTRYAQVAKYYYDKMKDGETLTPAEKARLELVEKEQCRLRNEIAGVEGEICN